MSEHVNDGVVTTDWITRFKAGKAAIEDLHLWIAEWESLETAPELHIWLGLTWYELQLYRRDRAQFAEEMEAKR